MKKKVLIFVDDPGIGQMYETANIMFDKKENVEIIAKSHREQVVECFCEAAPDVVMIFDFEPEACHCQENQGKKTYELLEERCRACQCAIVLTSIHPTSDFQEKEIPEKTIYLTMPMKMEKWKQEIMRLIID